MLGFIPFMIGEHKEAFWFPLAAGAIGGLFMSFIGLFCFLLLFMEVAKKVKGSVGIPLDRAATKTRSETVNHYDCDFSG